VAIVSSRGAAREMGLSFHPIAMRDCSGNLVGGVGVRFAF